MAQKWVKEKLCITEPSSYIQSFLDPQTTRTQLAAARVLLAAVFAGSWQKTQDPYS